MSFLLQSVRRDVALQSVEAVVTRFPPEPNGHLHVGHLKSLLLNISLSQPKGTCVFRFDDTNPKAEKKKYISSAAKILGWLGFQIVLPCFASDHSNHFYCCAHVMLKHRQLYIDDQTPLQHKNSKGSFQLSGKDSDARSQSVTDNVRLLKQMKCGRFRSQTKTLKAKIDMLSPNLNLRDPILSRISFASHHKTQHLWSIHPTYDFGQCTSDCIEGITHSLCTLEFESNRQLYDWLKGSLVTTHIQQQRAVPKQIEFSRLLISNLPTSKRQTRRMVSQRDVRSWDDLRLGTIGALRRLGLTRLGLQSFSIRTSTARAPSSVRLEDLQKAVTSDLRKHVPEGLLIANPVSMSAENFWKRSEIPIDVPNCWHFFFSGRKKFAIGGGALAEANDVGFLAFHSGSMLQLEFNLKVRSKGQVRLPDGGTVVRGLLVLDCQELEKKKVPTVSCVSSSRIRIVSLSLLSAAEGKLPLDLPAKVGVNQNDWESEGMRSQSGRRGYFVVDSKARKGMPSKWNFTSPL